MRQLIEKMFVAAHDNRWMVEAHDSAVLDDPGRRIAFTTDSFVVRPLFFPGGDIGSLAVNGTVNDLAMSGAQFIDGIAADMHIDLRPESRSALIAWFDAAPRSARVEIMQMMLMVPDFHLA